MTTSVMNATVYSPAGISVTTTELGSTQDLAREPLVHGRTGDSTGWLCQTKHE